MGGFCACFCLWVPRAPDPSPLLACKACKPDRAVIGKVHSWELRLHFFSVAPIVSDNAQLFRALHAQCLTSCPHILGATSQLVLIIDRPVIWFVFSWTLVDRLEILYYSLVLCLFVITDGDLRRNVGLEDWPSHQSSLSRGMWAWGKTKFWTASLVHQLHLELTSDPDWPRF